MPAPISRVSVSCFLVFRSGSSLSPFLLPVSVIYLPFSCLRSSFSSCLGPIPVQCLRSAALFLPCLVPALAVSCSGLPVHLLLRSILGSSPPHIRSSSPRTFKQSISDES